MKKIIVHNGTFHAHDVFAVAIAEMFGECEHVRTRDRDTIQKEIANGALVYDVGGDLAPTTDHHNWKGFNGDLSSMFPMDLIPLELVTKPLVNLLTDLACIDCGMSVTPEGIECRDYVNSLIKTYNPSWVEEPMPAEVEEILFKQAVNLARVALLAPQEFIMMRERQITTEYGKSMAFDTVFHAINEAMDKKRNWIALMTFVPWQEFVIGHNVSTAGKKIKFVLFPERNHDKNWRVQAVNVSADSFDLIQPIDATPETTKGCYFVHPNKFIAGFESIKDAKAWVETQA